MKRQDITKLHQLNIKELSSKRLEMEKQLNLVRLKIKTNQEKNVHLARSIRHDIARVNTIITQKQLASPQESVKLTQSQKLKPKAIKSVPKKISTKTTTKPKTKTAIKSQKKSSSNNILTKTKKVIKKG